MGVSIWIDHARVGLRLSAPGGDSVPATLTGVSDSLAPGRFNLGLIGGESRFELSGAGGADVAAELPLPAWAGHLGVDLVLPPGGGGRFSDFGFTVLDAHGRILGKNPLNSAPARLTTDLPRPTRA